MGYKLCKSVYICLCSCCLVSSYTLAALILKKYCQLSKNNTSSNSLQYVPYKKKNLLVMPSWQTVPSSVWLLCTYLSCWDICNHFCQPDLLHLYWLFICYPSSQHILKLLCYCVKGVNSVRVKFGLQIKVYLKKI